MQPLKCMLFIIYYKTHHNVSRGIRHLFISNLGLDPSPSSLFSLGDIEWTAYLTTLSGFDLLWLLRNRP